MSPHEVCIMLEYKQPPITRGNLNQQQLESLIEKHDDTYL